MKKEQTTRENHSWEEGAVNRGRDTVALRACANDSPVTWDPSLGN